MRYYMWAINGDRSSRMRIVGMNSLNICFEGLPPMLLYKKIEDKKLFQQGMT